MIKIKQLKLHSAHKSGATTAVFVVMSSFLSILNSGVAHAQTDSPYEAIRINNSQPIIDRDLFVEAGVGDEGDNINGPSMIRIPDWISPEDRADPSAVYYLYFGHHAGDYIRMAWAENVTGPWQLYQSGSQVPVGDRGVLDNGGRDISPDSRIIIEENHIASPDVHVDDENQRIILYFHSGSSTFFNGVEMDGQFSWVSTSPHGLDFNDNIEPVLLSTSYFRVFSHDDELYAFDNSASPRRALDADNPWEPPSDYYSDLTLPRLWEEHPRDLTQEPLEENLGLERAELRVRHTAVRVVGDEAHVFYSRRGDSPERIMMSTIDLSVGDWENWEFSYPPAPILTAEPGWEGGQFNPEPSEAGPAPDDANQLRDPALFEDSDGSLYLIYAGNGESALGIATLFSVDAPTIEEPPTEEPPPIEHPTSVDPTSVDPTSEEPSGTSASHNSGDAAFAVDGNQNTRWTTGTVQQNGQWFQLDLGSTQTVGSVTLDSSGSANDEPAGFTLSTSTNGSNFSTAASGTGSSNGITTINFDNRSARFIRITQTGSKDRNWWSIHEMTISDSDSDSDSNLDGPTRDGNWVRCANENQECDFSGTKEVAYGDGDSWNYQEEQNGVDCNNSTFGDPIRGTVKSCYYDD